MADSTDTTDTDSAAARTLCEIRCTHGRQAGHAVHRTQRQIVVSSPWGWRSGVVRTIRVVPEGHLLVVHCTEQDHDVTVRHHVPLPLEAGDAVALHERGLVLEYTDQWRSAVVVDGGLSAVPVPEDPARWPRRRDGHPDSVAAYIPG